MCSLAFGGEYTEEFDRFLRNLNLEIKCVHLEAEDRDVIIDLMQWVERVYMSLANETMNEEEKTMLNRKLSMLTTIYENYCIFASDLKYYKDHKEALREELLSIADYLELCVSIFSTMRLAVYTMKLFNSLNLRIQFGGNLIKSFKIPAFLRFTFQYLLTLKSYFGPYNILIISSVEYLLSKYVTQYCINLIEKDKRYFERVNRLLLEIDDIVTDIFPNTISEEVIIAVEKTLTDLSTEEKILAAVLISSIKTNPFIIIERDFLCKAFLFSRAEEVKELYSRMLLPINQMRQESRLKVLEKKLFHLKVTHCILGQPIVDVLFCLEPSFALYGLYSFCLFIGIRKFKHANTYMFANELREIASIC